MEPRAAHPRRAVLRGAAASAGAGITALTLPPAAAAASTTFTTGLGDAAMLLYVDATNATSWSGSGTTWTDLSGNGHSLPVNGTSEPTFTTTGLGISGGSGAFVCDGVDGSSGDGVAPATDGAVPAFAYGDAWSIAVWIRFDDLTGWQTIVGQGDQWDDALWFQKVSDTQPTQGTDQGTTRAADQLGVVLERGTGHRLQCYTSTAATVGTWYHLVATADASEVRVYLDGALAATAATDPTYGGSLKDPDATVMWYVASGWNAPTTTPFHGALAFLQVWTRALSAAEVADQYVATKGPYHGA